jgi:hypothetical protein
MIFLLEFCFQLYIYPIAEKASKRIVGIDVFPAENPCTVVHNEVSNCISVQWLQKLAKELCRRQKLCKRAQKISAAAPLRVMASRYNPCE